MQTPWATAAERMNRFARMDRSLARDLAELSKHQARDDKLASAIESGRVYGVRQQKYDMTLRRELNKDWRQPPTADPLHSVSA